MCYIQTNRGITGNSDTTKTNSPCCTMPWPCPRRSVVKSQVKCHSQGGQNKLPLQGRVKAPTRTKGPITQQEKMVPAAESEEDRANAKLCLSLDAIQASVETTSHVADRALAVRGGATQKGTESLVTSRVTHA